MFGFDVRRLVCDLFYTKTSIYARYAAKKTLNVVISALTKYILIVLFSEVFLQKIIFKLFVNI